MTDTVRVRGTGGMEFDMDMPGEGTQRREIVDAQIASGQLVVVESPRKPSASAAKK